MTQPQLFKRRPPAPLEFPVHCMIADLLRLSLKSGWLWFHYPAGEYRPKATAGRLKRMGVMAGVSDFLLVKPEGAQLHALELKRRGKTPSDDQLYFLQAVEAAGGKSAWVDSYDDATTVLKHWGAVRVS